VATDLLYFYSKNRIAEKSVVDCLLNRFKHELSKGDSLLHQANASLLVQVLTALNMAGAE
jgi:hypothetical protein